MVSKVMEQRFDELFQSLDTNGDGFIDVSDFEAVLTGLAARRGFEPGQPEYDGMRMQIMGGWERLRELGDADGDGRVTREEFVQSYSKMSETPEGMEQTGLEIAEQMIVANDSDGDGRLNFEEYQGMMGAWGASRRQDADPVRPHGHRPRRVRDPRRAPRQCETFLQRRIDRRPAPVGLIGG